MSKTKILFLFHLPPPIHGSSLVGASIRNSAVVNQTFDCRYINLLLSRTIGETGNAGWRKAMRLPAIFMRLLWYLLFYRPHTVYFALTATGAAFYRDVALVALLRIFKIKIVFHLHNKGYKKNAHSKLNHILYRFVFKNSKVILLSKYLYDDISEYVSLENIEICPNGIPFTKLKNKKQRHKTNIEKLNILFLSNLIESKGVYVLLEACKLLDKKNVDFSCTLIGGEGDITAKQLNEKIKESGLENKVNYAGKKYDEEKNSYWQNADMFVFPSYFETFGLVNLEAMQYSLPVVSTFEGGIPDVVEDGVTGFLVPQQDVQALADKLEVLIHNPELRKLMGAAGRKKYEEEFTLERFEGRMVEILNDVIIR